MVVFVSVKVVEVVEFVLAELVDNSDELDDEELDEELEDVELERVVLVLVVVGIGQQLTVVVPELPC